MKTSYKVGFVASAPVLATGTAVKTAAAQTSAPRSVAAAAAVAAAATPRPSITSVSFVGYYGTGAPSPRITINGTGFGSTPPAGTSDNVTPCGTFTDNGQVYGGSLYFLDDNVFEAGHSDAYGANCIGISVVSWSDNQEAYSKASFAAPQVGGVIHRL